MILHEVYRDQAGEHRYAVSLPPEFAPDQKWPVLLFLHGAGERGTDGLRPLSVGLGPMLGHMPRFPCIVVFPQCEDLDGRYLTGWLAESPDGQRAMKILAEVERKFPVDAKRRILCGWSMGGYGALSIAAANPHHWSALLILAGGGEPAMIGKLADSRVPVWAIHGAGDVLIPPARSQEMIDALLQQKGRGECTILDGVDHDVWIPAFLNSRVTDWLLNPQSDFPQSIDWESTIRESRNLSVEDAPFVPTAIIPQGLGVRLGNGALDSWSRGAAAAIPQEALTGELEDIVREFDSGGEQITVQFDGHRFHCRVEDCRIAALSGGWLRIQFGISPLTLEFYRATLQGQQLQASTGPFQVVLGHRHPVWLTIDLRPEVHAGRVELVPLQQEFELPDDNWFVSRPGAIQVSRGELLPQHVETGLIGGLYLNRAAIVEQVQSVVPGLLESIETRLNSMNAGQSVSRMLWPLPFLAPRVRLQAHQILTDEDGISVLLDILVAGPDDRNDTALREFTITPVTLSQLGQSSQLSFLVSLNIVEAFSDCVVSQHGMRVNVLDTPTSELHEFAEPDFLRNWLPEVTTDRERIRAVVSLVAPLRIEVKDVVKNTAHVHLHTGGIQLRIQEALESGDWQEVATLSMSLSQPLEISQHSASSNGAFVQTVWGHAVEVRLLSSTPATVSSQAAAALLQQFRTGWLAWISTHAQQRMELEDLKLGNAYLSPQGLTWRRSIAATSQTPDLLKVDFSGPMAAVINRSSQLVQLETHRPDGSWSEPILIHAGTTCRLPSTTDLVVRNLRTPHIVQDWPLGTTLIILDKDQMVIE